MSEWVQKNFIYILIGIGTIGLSMTIVPVILYMSHFNGQLSLENSDWGFFGDFWAGTANPILGFLALLALLFTLWYQREELKLSREELSKSTRALEEQSDSMQLQNFEHTFFEMLRLLTDTINNIEVKDFAGFTLTKGRSSFKYLYDTLTTYFTTFESDIGSPEGLSSYRQQYQSKFYVYHEEELSSYFLTFEKIMDHINSADMTYLKKQFYADIFKAQLSPFELLLLFYHGLAVNAFLKSF